jgi:adenylate cyclase
MTEATEQDAGRNEALWRKTLITGHPGKVWGRKFMRLLPSAPRCKACHNPFGGIGGRICGAIGMRPSRKNPRLCALCCEKMPPGGAEVEIAVLFADVRGSTALAERLGPAAFAAALNDFYATVTDVLVRYDATVDKLIGDEVMAFFVPGFCGPQFKRSAVEAGRSLLRALGYGGENDASLPVGVGIDAGTAFVGNVGAPNYVDFTALGDPVNTAARIQAAAGEGELLVSETAFAAVADRYAGTEARTLDVKGKQDPIRVRSVPLSEAV